MRTTARSHGTGEPGKAATVDEAQPPAHYVSFAPAKVDEHRYRCPICHEVVDSRDLDAVAPHLEPGHQAPGDKREAVSVG